MSGAKISGQIDPTRLLEANVHDHEIGLRCRNIFQRFRGAVRLAANIEILLATDAILQAEADNFVVVHDKNLRFLS